MSAEIINLGREKEFRDSLEVITHTLSDLIARHELAPALNWNDTVKNVFRSFLDEPVFNLKATYHRKHNHFLAIANGFSPKTGTRSYRLTRLSDLGFVEARDFETIPSADAFVPNTQKEFQKATELDNEDDRQIIFNRVKNRLDHYPIEKRLNILIQPKNWTNKKSNKLMPANHQHDVANIDYLKSIDDLMLSTWGDRAKIAAGMLGLARGQDSSLRFEDLKFGGESVRLSEDILDAARYYNRTDSIYKTAFDRIMTVLENEMRHKIHGAFTDFQQKLDQPALEHLREIPETATPQLYSFLSPRRKEKRKTSADPDDPKSKKKIWWEKVPERDKGDARAKFIQSYPVFVHESDLLKHPATREIDKLAGLPDSEMEPEIDRIAADIWASEIIDNGKKMKAIRAIRGMHTADIGPEDVSKLTTFLPYVGELADLGLATPRKPEDWEALLPLVKIDKNLAALGIKPACNSFRETMEKTQSIEDAYAHWMIDADDGASYTMNDLMDYYESVTARLMMALLAARKDHAENILIQPLEEELSRQNGNTQVLQKRIQSYRKQFAEITPQLIEQISFPDTRGFRRQSVQKEIDAAIRSNDGLSLSGRMLEGLSISEQIDIARRFTANNQEMIDGLREIKLSTAFSGHARNFSWPTLDNPPDAFYRDEREGDMTRRVTFIDRGDQLNREAYRLQTTAQAPWRYINENVHFMVIEKTYDRKPLALAVLEEVQDDGQPLRLTLASRDDYSNEPELYFAPDLRHAARDDIQELVHTYIDWANAQDFDADKFEAAREELEDRLQPDMGLEARIGYDYKDKFNNRRFFRLINGHIPEQFRETDDSGFLNHPHLVRAVDNIIARYVPDYKRYLNLYEVPSSNHSGSSPLADGFHTGDGPA